VADVVKNNDPEYDFTAADGFGHKLWVIRDKKTNDRITEIFAGHTRRSMSPTGITAQPPRRAWDRSARQRPRHTGNESIAISSP